MNLINKHYQQVLLFALFILSPFSQQLKAQGVDVVFLMDNSGSIDDTEWTNMSKSTRTLIDEILGCNPNNRATVVHYGATRNGQGGNRTYTPKIYIESDFSNDATAVKGFLRRSSDVGVDDFAPEAVTLIGNALDNISNANIVSSQKKLDKDTKNKLVIFIFTDATRNYYTTGNSGASLLVSRVGDPFGVYNQFKKDRNANFVVLRANIYTSLDGEANIAAATIASVGGSYNGVVENNPGDPEGNGVKPRRAIMSDTFDISSLDIATIADNICRSCAPVVNISAITPPTQTVFLNGVAQPLIADATGMGNVSYQWYSNTTNSTVGGTLIAGATALTYNPPTFTAGTRYYYVVVSDNYCDGKSISPIVSVTVNCTKPGDFSTAGLPTRSGITTHTKSEGWPGNVPNGFLALESNTKGMVITRVQNSTKISEPKEGMIIYNIDERCVQLYNGSNWKCIKNTCDPVVDNHNNQ